MPSGAQGRREDRRSGTLAGSGLNPGPEQRRRGYARAVLESLLERARQAPDVRTFRATVSPTNAPSLGLIGQYPFVEVGEQWDDEDGLEIIYEIPVG